MLMTSLLMCFSCRSQFQTPTYMTPFVARLWVKRLVPCWWAVPWRIRVSRIFYMVLYATDPILANEITLLGASYYLWTFKDGWFFWDSFLRSHGRKHESADRFKTSILIAGFQTGEKPLLSVNLLQVLSGYFGSKCPLVNIRTGKKVKIPLLVRMHSS